MVNEAPMSDAERTRQQQINDWLPITSARNAKWWYSAFHNVTAMVGAGVLTLPYALAQLGWGPGIVILIMSWIITLYTLWQMVEMHEMVPGKRIDRYHELGQEAFGPKLGAMDCGASTSNCRGWSLHSVYGDRRKIIEESA